MAAPTQGKKYIDLLTAFPFGIQSGLAPLLLPKEQCAFAVNTTFRGGYATDRPPVQKLTLNFGGDVELQNAVRKGFFQGAGVYRPDFGSSQILAQISGRLFTFTENGVMWDVAEITIPGDPNDATTNQVWMWQAEKWMIISDGTSKLPIFYDGVSCRRSYGPSVQLAVTTGAAYSHAKPSDVGINGVLTVALTAPYSGPFNVPVRFNNALYQPTQSPTGGYGVILTNYGDTPGDTVPSGSAVSVQPGYVGYIQTLTTGHFFGPYIGANDQYRIGFAVPHGLSVGEALNIPTTGNPGHCSGSVTVGAVISTTEIATEIPCFGGFLQGNFNVGALVQRATAGPTVIIGYTTANYVVPAVGANITVSLDQAYTGADNQSVWVGGKQYTIANPATVPSATLYLVNITDTSTVNYVPPLTISSVPEIPACRMGAYGMGQVWFSAVDGLSFGPSDLVGSSAGTPANNYRDAVLKTSDVEVMGMFRLPVAGEIITSMTFVATLDQALGQGPLQVGVASGMFSVRAPFTLIDFQGIQNLVAAIANPILTKSLIGFGPIAQNSTVLANSDTIFRSYQGINSLILARRDFSDLGGNTPISREVTRALENDNQSLLSYSSAIVFDNRLRMTCAPNVSGQGVFHQGEAVLNYDLLSSLRGKAQPVWDGLWTGTNILQYTKGLFGPVERAFSFTFNITDTQIELYELLPTGGEHFDNGDVRIKWIVETPVVFGPNVKPLTTLVRMIDGEMYVSEVNGRLDVTVEYRPLFYPCWRPWTNFSICADMVPENAQEQVRVRMGFGEPDPKDCDPINNRPYRNSEGYQLRLTFVGHAKLWGVKLLANELPEPAFEAPICTPLCLDVPDPD